MILWCKDSYTSTEVIRHLHVSGLLKNRNDLGVSKSSHFLCRITLVSLPELRAVSFSQCTERVAFMQPVRGRCCRRRQVQWTARLPAAHKGHHFCKKFTKYSVPSLSLGWNMICNMLHKCWWLFLVWNLRLLKIEEEIGDFVVCYHFLYELPDVGFSQISTAWGNFTHAHIVITNSLITTN